MISKAKAISVYLVTAIITAIAAFESLPSVPYAPFFFVYAFLLLIFTFAFKSIFISKLKNKEKLAFFTRRGVGWGLLYIFSFFALVGGILTILGLNGPFGWDLLYVYQYIYYTHQFPFFALHILSFIFFVLWTGILEEIFYRGILYPSCLALHHKESVAAFICSFLFALRQSLGILYFEPYPWGAGIIYFIFSFLAGELLIFLYKKSNSLLPCLYTHTIINIIIYSFLLFYFNTIL